MSRQESHLIKQKIIDALQSLQALPSLALMIKDQQFFIPKTLEALAELYKTYPNARLLSGSTDIGLWVTKQHRQLDNLIFINHIPALKTINNTADYVEIGAGVSLQDAFTALIAQNSGWQELARRFASRQIKNAGTLGGNIANGSPIGDSMPALIAQSAKLVLRCGEQVRTLALDEFYIAYQKNALQPSEFITAIQVPNHQNLPDELSYFATYKVAKRFDADISAVCGAYFVKLDKQNKVSEIRIVYGGMAEIPKRAKHLEAALHNQEWLEANIDNALSKIEQDFSPLTDGRASAHYRLLVAKNLLKRFYFESQVTAGTTNEPKLIRLTQIA